jgi:hypothetical protein
MVTANVIGTLTDSIVPRRRGSCAVLLNNRERPLIWKAVIVGRTAQWHTVRAFENFAAKRELTSNIDKVKP